MLLFRAFFVELNSLAKLSVGMKGHQGFIASFYEKHIPMLLCVRLYANIHQHFTFPSLSLSLSLSLSSLSLCLSQLFPFHVASSNLSAVGSFIHSAKNSIKKRIFSSKNAKNNVVAISRHHQYTFFAKLFYTVSLT